MAGRYIDTGCDVSPSCLRCPLERCKYEARAGRVYAMWMAVNIYGQRQVDVARRFGVSRAAVCKASHLPPERFRK